MAPRRLAARVFLVRSGPEFVAVICARRPGTADAGSGPDLLGRNTVAGVCLHFHLERPARLVQAQWLAAAAHDVKPAVFRPRGSVTRFPVKVRRWLGVHLAPYLRPPNPLRLGYLLPRPHRPRLRLLHPLAPARVSRPPPLLTPAR